jgi:hypothetical protein
MIHTSTTTNVVANDKHLKEIKKQKGGRRNGTGPTSVGLWGTTHRVEI